MSLQSIKTLVNEATQRATKVDHGGMAGVKTRFLVKDKAAIIREIKKSELSYVDVCQYLSQHGEVYSTWSSRFYAWNKDWVDGKLDIDLAISVQRKKPGKSSNLINPLHSVLDQMVKERRSLADIESCFAIAFARVKDDLTKSAVDSVETILRSRGLTLEDLKGVLSK